MIASFGRSGDKEIFLGYNIRNDLIGNDYEKFCSFIIEHFKAYGIDLKRTMEYSDVLRYDPNKLKTGEGVRVPFEMENAPKLGKKPNPPRKPGVSPEDYAVEIMLRAYEEKLPPEQIEFAKKIEAVLIGLYSKAWVIQNQKDRQK